MARDYLSAGAMLRGRDGTEELPYDSLHVGSARTFSNDSRITDSAAGGTALSTSVKIYNGAIAVDTIKQPGAPILEGAERRGMATGLVVTSGLTHATPAVFSAHVPDQDLENEIAKQQLNQGIEVLLGGGRRHFLPDQFDNCARNDERNLIDTVRRKGYQVVEIADELAQASGDRLLGLFSNGHTAVDAGPYAHGPGATHFIGNHDNTSVARTLADLLGIDLKALTARVRTQ